MIIHTSLNLLEKFFDTRFIVENIEQNVNNLDSDVVALKTPRLQRFKTASTIWIRRCCAEGHRDCSDSRQRQQSGFRCCCEGHRDCSDSDSVNNLDSDVVAEGHRDAAIQDSVNNLDSDVVALKDTEIAAIQDSVNNLIQMLLR